MGSLSAPALNARKVFLAKIKPGADDTIKKNKEMLDSIKDTVFTIEDVIKKAQIAPLELHVTLTGAGADAMSGVRDCADGLEVRVDDDDDGARL